jgi:hypothetical protein
LANHLQDGFKEIPMKLAIPRWVLPLALAALASGCVVAPIDPYYDDDATVVGVPPPAPLYEAVGVAPAVGMVWIGGHWAWHGHRHVWRAGHWAHGRHGHHWEPHRWDRGRGGWVHRGGHWRRGGR